MLARLASVLLLCRFAGLTHRLVHDPPQPEVLGDLDKHCPIIDIDDVPSRQLGDIEGQPIDIHIGLADVDVARTDEEVDQSMQVEASDSVFHQLSAFVAHGGDGEVVLPLHFEEEVDGLIVGGSLLLDECFERRFVERPRPVEHNPVKIRV
jgi:hypothetical protein